MPVYRSLPSRLTIAAGGLAGAVGVMAAASASHMSESRNLAAIAAIGLAHGPALLALGLAAPATKLFRIAAALLARNANRLGLKRKPWVKSSLAPGSKAVSLYLEEGGLLPELEQLGFGIVAFACTTCNGMSGALDPVIQQEIIDRDLYATAVLSGNRNFDGRIHPYA